MALLYSDTLAAAATSDAIAVLAGKPLGVIVDTQVQILVENAESGIYQPLALITGPDFVIPPATNIKVQALSSAAQVTIHGDEE